MTTVAASKARSTPVVVPPHLVNAVIMAAMIATFWLLFTHIHRFSASLDALVFVEPGEAFITASRIGASLVLLLILKEILVALRAFHTLVKPALPPAHLDPVNAPSVSVIVPAFNEAQTIRQTLKSLAALDYPKFDIVVVDDGSSDNTLAIAREFAETQSKVAIRVLTQPNRGKWKALNEGIRNSTGDLVLCIDADSSLSRDALRRMAPHFSDREVGAVSGQVQVRNQINLVTRLQALEYLVANGSARTAQSGSGSVLIVPGPIGLFRRATLDKINEMYFAESSGEGPFSPHTFAEDFELSVMICAMGAKVVYEPEAKAFTRAPETLGTLLNQRYRWLRGSMQVGRRYRDGNWPKQKERPATRWWMTITTIGDLYVVPVASLLLLASIVWTLMIGDVKDVFLLWMMVWVFHALAALLFVRVHGENPMLCLLSPLQTIYGSILVTGVWTHAVIDHLFGRSMRW